MLPPSQGIPTAELSGFQNLAPGTQLWCKALFFFNLFALIFYIHQIGIKVNHGFLNPKWA
jgi:hypothetical protein